MAKRANGEGSKPRKKPNGRYEARATVDTPKGRRRVSFYGATAKEAAEKRTTAVADRNRGALFSDPGRLTKVEKELGLWAKNSFAATPRAFTILLRVLTESGSFFLCTHKARAKFLYIRSR